jgi:hypothetical protein
MIFKELWDLLEHELFLRESTIELFNQYRDRDLSVDLPDANEIRKENLWNYLNSFSENPSILIVGEAAGPWGCRFSGVPFTGEKQFSYGHSLPFSGHRTSRDHLLLEVRKLPPYISQSAKIFWDVMKPFHPKFFIWDCVPFHPHNPEEILSIRTPTSKELDSFSGILRKIKRIIDPTYNLALGRKAQNAFSRIGEESKYIPHPSHGGANRFRSGIEEFFNMIR